MRKIVLIILFWTVLLFGHEYQYDVKASLVGKVGEVKVKSNHTKNRYSISLSIKATGFAKSLSDNLVEKHSSRGTIKDGEYYSNEYKIVKSYKDIKYIKKYTFDYKRKKIKKSFIKWKAGKKIYQKTVTLNYFCNNDVLTLYPNVIRFKKKHNSGRYSMKLAGAERYGNKLDFEMLKGGKKLEIRLHRSFFSGGVGVLDMDMDASDTVEYAKLKGVKLLGTMRLYPVK